MRKKSSSELAFAVAVGATAFVTSTSRAQAPDVPPASATPSSSSAPAASAPAASAPAASVSAAPSTTAPPAPPTWRPPPEDFRDPPEDKPPPKPDPTDHDAVVGHFGVGYFGQLDVPLGFGSLRKAGATEPAQLVGVRYWWRRIRVDAALGLNVQSGSQQVVSKSTDQASTLVVAARVGVPIAIFSGRHYTFFAGPEIAVGHASETVPGTDFTSPMGPTGTLPDTSHDGMRWSVGGRAGAEIQFGFIGIPHLALDATVGLSVDVTSGSTKGPPVDLTQPGADPFTAVESKFNHVGFQTTLSHQPWNIFISNVAAVYYF